MSAAAKKKTTSTIARAGRKTHVGGSIEKFRRLRRADCCHRRELHQEDRRAYDNQASGRSHQPFDMPGQYRDAESGFSYNWNRHYDPTIGRYLQEEPLVSGIDGMAREYSPSGNLPYTYAAGNPQTFFDPDGEGIVDCAEALARLAYLQAKLAQRIAENCHCPDAGHDKAIEQLKNAVAKQAAKVAKHCTDPSTLFQALIIAAAAAALGPAAAPLCAL